MPVYSSKDKVKCGVPLGGVGAGKIEILPNGCFDYLTFLNNWRDPIVDMRNKEAGFAKGLLGFHFGAQVKWNGGSVVRILQTEKLNNYPTIKEIKYSGIFPKAVLAYHDQSLPVNITLNAYSSFIPGDYKNSSIPGVLFDFSIENKKNIPVDVTLFMICRNVSGKWYINRTNKPVKMGQDEMGIEFTQTKRYKNDSKSGDLCMSVKASGKIGYMNGWNSQTVNFIYTPETLGLDAVDYLIKCGQLPNSDSAYETKNENIQLASCLSDTFRIPASKTNNTTFSLGWHYPKHDYGHYYEKQFKSAPSVCKYLNKNKKALKKKVDLWTSEVLNAGMPEWLGDAVLNNLYTMISGSWLTKDGNFTLYESPQICPLMGTIDVGFYATLPVLLLFPEWEKRYLESFADAQRKDGYVPHDLGFECLDMPSDGTTFYKWKDLNSKFVLMLYRDYLRTKDKAYLKRLYPNAKKALAWLEKKSVGSHGLPENEGADQTFDTWDFFGVNSYTAGLYLAALRALEEMALILNDTVTADSCARKFKKGQKSYEDLLWSGEYYYTSVNGKKIYDSCTVGQLTGQWIAHLLGLGYILDKKKIRSSLKMIDKLNNHDSKYGCTNSVYPSGKRDDKFIHSRNYWPCVTYVYSSLCIYEGLTEQGLKASKKTYSTFANTVKNVWNQPDCVNPKDGSSVFGDYYMRNMGIWSIVFALGSKDKKVENMLKRLENLK
ncbi:MAG: GH116 family glycosyl hydrolase [Elusimicrobiota bacterium]